MNKELTPYKKTQINSFWKWFKQHENQINDALLNQHYSNDIFKTFESKTNKISKRIGFVLSANKIEESQMGKLTITANGYRKLFYLVHAIVNLAPNTPLYDIEAFINPVEDLKPYIDGTDDPFTFQDFEIKTSDLYFLPTDYNTNRKRIKIKVFTDKYRFHYDNETLEVAIQIIVQNLIGEINLRKTLAEIQLAQLPDNPQNLIPLYELNEYILFLQKINQRVKIEI